MLGGSGLSTANDDATLQGWSEQDFLEGLELDADGLTYCDAEEARAKLKNQYDWVINDAGKDCSG